MAKDKIYNLEIFQCHLLNLFEDIESLPTVSFNLKDLGLVFCFLE